MPVYVYVGTVGAFTGVYVLVHAHAHLCSCVYMRVRMCVDNSGDQNVKTEVIGRYCIYFYTKMYLMFFRTLSNKAVKEFS